MARLARLTYREAAQAKLFRSLRQLMVLVLAVIFGVLISVSVNAQKTSEKKADKKKAKIFKYRNRSKANHYAYANDACEVLAKKRTSHPKANPRLSKLANAKAKQSGPEVLADTRSLSLQQSIIREMVALDLKERKTDGPIELAPLSLKMSGNALLVEDVNPLLIAVEFALQGKTIMIQGQSLSSDQEKLNNSVISLTDLKNIMNKMGVPNDRIAFAGELLMAVSTQPTGKHEVRLTAF